MARDDWYRRTSWSDADEQEFFERLGKCRTALHKSQYLRLQAVALVETKQPRLIRVALRLLETLFAEYPDPSQLAAAHLLAAECYEKVGDFPQATVHFRRALEAQKLPGAPDVGVALAFPWFVARHGLADLYDEALGTLDKAETVFPVQIFREAAVRALIADSRQDPGAPEHARRALDAAGLKRSPLTRAPSVGLVGPEYREVVERLGRMVG